MESPSDGRSGYLIEVVPEFGGMPCSTSGCQDSRRAELPAVTGTRFRQLLASGSSVSGVRHDTQQGPGHRWKLHGEPLGVQSVGRAWTWDDTLGICLAVGVEQ